MQKLLIAFFLIALGSIAQAQVPTAIYSKNVLMAGPCWGGDTTWNSSPAGTAMKVNPWAGADITIVSIEMTFYNSPPIMFAEAGDAGQDIMLNLGSGETHGRHDFPAGAGMKLANGDPNSNYLDAHVACVPNGAYNTFHLFYTIYYTVP